MRVGSWRWSGVLGAFLVILGCVSNASAVSPLKDTPHWRDIHAVEARDGVRSYVFSYEGVGKEASNPTTIVMQPGYTQTPASVESVARDYLIAGAKVDIGQVREAGREIVSGKGRYNGLQEIFFNDGVAHLVDVFRRNEGKPIALWGNSMGGLIWLAILTNPHVRKDVVRQAQAVCPPNSPIQWVDDLDGRMIESLQVIGSPSHFRSIQHNNRRLVQFVHKRLDLVVHLAERIPDSVLNFVQRSFDEAYRLDRTGRLRDKMKAAAIRATLVAPVSAIMKYGIADAKYIKKEDLRRFVAKGFSAIPREPGVEFLHAIGDGEILGRRNGHYENPEIMAPLEGRPLLQLALFPASIPVLIVSPDDDLFCPTCEQKDLFDGLPDGNKAWLRVPGKGHLYFMEDRLREVNKPTIDFFRDPRGFIERQNKSRAHFSTTHSCSVLLGSGDDEVENTRAESVGLGARILSQLGRRR
ncbi:MAG TPA: hypothetical protein PLH57_04890 [Oligoflexia bacterium]|nr:hypothetical protein [Oligoflexia bacterium]